MKGPLTRIIRYRILAGAKVPPNMTKTVCKRKFTSLECWRCSASDMFIFTSKEVKRFVLHIFAAGRPINLHRLPTCKIHRISYESFIYF